MLAGLAPARRRLVLALVAAVVVGALVAAGLLVSRLQPGESRAVPLDRPGPVLLVPGYGGSTGALGALADRLTRAGRDATVVALPGDGTGDLAMSAEALAAAVRAALARTHAASVDVVGYSAGGVVARLWAADGGASVVRRVVTLGAPHHGTQLADLAGDLVPQECPAACRQLGTGSELLRRLDAEKTAAGPAWVSIWTTQDRTVQPPESAQLRGALNIAVQSVCASARVEHGELPTSPVVQAMVLVELAAGPPSSLTPADCARLGGTASS